MKKIQFDCGIQEYRLGNGVLRFNPADPNVYDRFSQAGQKLTELEQELARQAGQADTDAVKLLTKADGEMKQLLGWVFGPDNNLDALLGGVNLLAVAGNGRRVMENLLEALEPILLEGAESCVRQQKAAAVKKAKQRRGEA